MHRISGDVVLWFTFKRRWQTLSFDQICPFFLLRSILISISCFSFWLLVFSLQANLSKSVRVKLKEIEDQLENDPSLSEEERQSKIKSEKIKIALEKLKKANIQKVKRLLILILYILFYSIILNLHITELSNTPIFI